MPTTIGIPRALLNHKYGTLWQVFFRELGLQTILSPATNRRITEDGLAHSLDESCLPVKLFAGHIIALRGQADYIFVPRFVSVERGGYICCKFLGIPDVVRNTIADLPPLLTVDIDLNRHSLRRSLYRLGRRFTGNPLRLERAFRAATRAQAASEARRHAAADGAPADLTIGLIAHSYNIYDTYANMDIIRKLEEMGARVITPDMLAPALTRREGRRFSREIYWTYNRELVGTAVWLARTGRARGIILLTSFGCGPDSLLSELLMRRLKDTVPVMSLVFDEETAEAGLLTRLESFVDMVRRGR